MQINEGLFRKVALGISCFMTVMLCISMIIDEYSVISLDLADKKHKETFKHEFHVLFTSSHIQTYIYYDEGKAGDQGNSEPEVESFSAHNDYGVNNVRYTRMLEEEGDKCDTYYDWYCEDGKIKYDKDTKEELENEMTVWQGLDHGGRAAYFFGFAALMGSFLTWSSAVYAWAEDEAPKKTFIAGFACVILQIVCALCALLAWGIGGHGNINSEFFQEESTSVFGLPFEDWVDFYDNIKKDGTLAMMGWSAVINLVCFFASLILAVAYFLGFRHPNHGLPGSATSIPMTSSRGGGGSGDTVTVHPADEETGKGEKE